jgi:hypothetical protein
MNIIVVVETHLQANYEKNLEEMFLHLPNVYRSQAMQVEMHEKNFSTITSYWIL